MIALGDIFGLGGSSFISAGFLEKKIRGRNADQRIQLLWRDRQRCCSCGCTDDLQKSGIGTSGCKRGHLGVCVTYYTCIALGAPFIIVALTPSNQLRTEGFATASMVGSVLGAVVNIILDPIMIFCTGAGVRPAQLQRP